ncbi:MAG: hypothetical protein WEB52_15510 [Dehalococcoidia bacterium]
MTDRLANYAASLLVEWFGGRSGRDYKLTSAREGDTPVFLAESPEGTLAIAIAAMWEPDANPSLEQAREAMQERLTAGLVRGPYLLWAPPRAAPPLDEPNASEFVQRVQQAAAPLSPGERGEVELSVSVQLAKVRDEGGYASVIGGLSRWWTLITERVNGTFHVNSSKMRRAPQSAALREAVFDRIGELSKGMSTGDAIEFDTVEAWTVQRLREDPLGERGFAIVQAPPGIDPSEGTLMRRLIRKRLKDANAALDAVEADLKGVGLIAIYEYAEHENVGSFVKSLDPALFAKLQLLAAVVDGEIRPIFQPR